MLKHLKTVIASEELTPKQEKLDINDNGKIDAEDLKDLREGETKTESSSVKTIMARLSIVAERESPAP